MKNLQGQVMSEKNQAFAGELIEVRSFEVRVVHEAVIVPALVIAQDEDHVGPVVCLRERAGGEHD